jgi:hypothetical protein
MKTHWLLHLSDITLRYLHENAAFNPPVSDIVLLCYAACSILRVSNSNWMARPTSPRSQADDTRFNESRRSLLFICS